MSRSWITSRLSPWHGSVRWRKAPWKWEAFDLPARTFKTVENPARLSQAIPSYQGWSITTVPESRENFLFTLIAVSPQNQRIPLGLLPAEDRRWTSYTFIPPNPGAGHTKLTVAIGCLGGTAVLYSLPDGRKTRVYLGHSEAVYGLAPSADGRWLATASADETVRLWSLSGCDVRPALGATLVLDPQGGLTVADLGMRCFAREMGLERGDRITNCTRGPQRVQLAVATPDALRSSMESIEPGVTILVDVVRNGRPERFQTSRRDSPALSLFIGSKQEWIIWMPEGYYHSSIAGDRELLGWHVNKQPNVATTTAFYPMSRYQEQLRKREVVDRLLATGDVPRYPGPGAPGSSLRPASGSLSLQASRAERSWFRTRPRESGSRQPPALTTVGFALWSCRMAPSAILLTPTTRA